MFWEAREGARSRDFTEDSAFFPTQRRVLPQHASNEFVSCNTEYVFTAT
jgi:hypothetical protein